MKMKICLLCAALLMAVATPCFALTDAEFHEMAAQSAEFKKLDAELNQMWKQEFALVKDKPEQKQALLESQRAWINSERDSIAAAFMQHGLSKADAYMRTTKRRLRDLELWHFNNHVADPALGNAKADEAFYTDEDYPENYRDGKFIGQNDVDKALSELAGNKLARAGGTMSHPMNEAQALPLGQDEDIVFGVQSMQKMEKYRGRDGIIEYYTQIREAIAKNEKEAHERQFKGILIYGARVLFYQRNAQKNSLNDALNNNIRRDMAHALRRLGYHEAEFESLFGQLDALVNN